MRKQSIYALRAVRLCPESEGPASFATFARFAFHRGLMTEESIYNRLHATMSTSLWIISSGDFLMIWKIV